jgi:hypothetical protein
MFYNLVQLVTNPTLQYDPGIWVSVAPRDSFWGSSWGTALESIILLVGIDPGTVLRTV